jgi:cytochrome c
MKRSHMLFLAAGLAVAGQAFADPGEMAARNSDCFACHAVDHKIVGPAFKDVAAKYKGDAGAPARLMAKIKNGGSGVWGTMPMPPHPNLSDNDLKNIVHWVLTRS